MAFGEYMDGAHSTRVRQAPGWWPGLLEAICACGWRGPTRNIDQAGSLQRARALLDQDARDHIHPRDTAPED